MTRFWVTLRQFAFVLTAFLAACNGAGKATPAAVSPSAAATSSASASSPTPASSSTPSPVPASTISPAAVPLFPSASTTVGLPDANGISGILVLTAGPSLPAGVTVSIASASTGAPVPQSVRRLQSASALASWHIVFAGSAASVTLTSPPSFTIIGATNQSALSAELFDVTATGSPILFNHSTNASFTATGSVTLNLSHTYYLELVSGSTATPAPAATPSPPATAFAGGATLVASFAANVPASAHSASFAFSGTTGGPQVVAIPAGCSPGCTVTVSAPPGNSTVQVLLYASANAFGTPLAHGTTSVVESQNQSTAVSVGLIGIVASLAITLNPATVTIGQATPITIDYIAVDAAGDHLAPGSFMSTAGGTRTTPIPDFDAPTLTVPAIAIAVDDPTGAVSTNNNAYGGTGLAYSGFGSGPATITVQVETCSSVTSGTCSNPVIITSASAPLTYAHSLSAVTRLR